MVLRPRNRDDATMTASRTRHRLAISCVAWLTAMAVVAGQDSLPRARELYNLASYDEALLVLNRLQPTAARSESSEIAGYQVFCLLALGRKDEAKRAIAALVRADPLYRPSEATTSPRTRAAFDEVRRGLLPGIVQETYDKAKAAFDAQGPANCRDGIRSRPGAARRARTGRGRPTWRTFGVWRRGSGISARLRLRQYLQRPSPQSRKRRISQPPLHRPWLPSHRPWSHRPTIPATRASSRRWLCRDPRPPGSRGTRSRGAGEFRGVLSSWSMRWVA